MSTAQWIGFATLFFLLLGGGLWGIWWLWLLLQSQQRLARGTAAVEPDDVELVREQRSRLGWWLFQSGFRQLNAVPVFLLATAIAAISAFLLAFAIYQSDVIDLLETLFRSIPGNVGEVFLPLIWLSPIASAITVGALPAILVRGRRRRRVSAIEQDLPITLDLLATLAEAGLSFDAALERVLETQRQIRPLAEDFRLFRLEILTGRGRIDALRRLDRHVNVPWFSIFVSALIHAEQVGAGLATTLRGQADDLRNRRRERALAKAMSVPVKLLFPLIVCFLPGIMIASLGPILFQIVQALDQHISNAFGG